MPNPLGAVLFILGLILSFTCWITKRYEAFLIQVLLGPILVAAGWELMK